MKRTRNVLLLIVLLTKTLHAEDRLFWILAGGAQAATIYDIQTTRNVMQRCPTCYEANPIMKPFVASSPAAFSVAVGLSAGGIYGAFKLRKKGVRYWWVPVAAPLAVHTIAGLNNSRIR